MRCGWAKTSLSIPYHDNEWGVPVHDDRVLFEFLILEGAQAGLSWETILAKREHYRKAFAGFDPERVARFTPARVEKLLTNPGLVRNRLKIQGAIKNARAFLELQREHGSFDAFLWARVAGTPVVNRRKSLADIPPQTALSDELSRDLRSRGFTFVGSTICYAFLQAVGVVNDHLITCERHPSRDARHRTAAEPREGERYVAFLRGINLGKRRVEMSKLRVLFEALGFTGVATFIASGNVLFTASAERRDVLERTIEQQLSTGLGFEVETFVRTAKEVEATAAARPFPIAQEEKAHGLYVTFHRDALPTTSVRQLEAFRTTTDAFRVDGSQVFWLCDVPSSQSDVWKSTAVKALKLPTGTMRNVSTVRKIARLLQP